MSTEFDVVELIEGVLEVFEGKGCEVLVVWSDASGEEGGYVAAGPGGQALKRALVVAEHARRELGGDK